MNTGKVDTNTGIVVSSTVEDTTMQLTYLWLCALLGAFLTVVL